MAEPVTRTISPEDLAQLKRDREAADARYNAALTAVDHAVHQIDNLPHPPPGPDEHQVTPLNQQWQIAGAPPAMSGWRGRLAGFVWRVMEPALANQERFNSALVDHVNRSVPRERAVSESIDSTIGLVRRHMEATTYFQSALVVYLQALTPYVDTKDYEFAGLARRTAEDAQVTLAKLDSVWRGIAAAMSGLSDEVMKRHDAFRSGQGRHDLRLDELTSALSAVQQQTLALRRELSRAAVAGASAAANAPLAPSGAVAAPVDTSQQMLASDPVLSQQYAGFEDLFRGSEDDIRARMADYVVLFQGASDVVDLGCGRGEFLGLLREAGISARGVDQNHEMAERCRADGLDVAESDALAYLRAAAPGSVGGLIAAQVVEHLQPDYLLQLLAAAADALRPGAPIVLETINPACWSAFFNSYIRDLTHARPVHPDTLKFLVTAAGFSDAAVQWRSPYPERGKLAHVPEAARDQALQTPGLAHAINTADRNADLLNAFMFTYQDYAVVARRP